MSKKILIIFWGNPLYDGRCINMVNQCLNEKHQLKEDSTDEEEFRKWEGIEEDWEDFNKQDNSKNKTAKLVRVPKFSEVPYPTIMEPNLVIEYYSR